LGTPILPGVGVDFGGTYRDNIVYAWGTLDPVAMPPLGKTFGVVTATFTPPNHYQVTIRTEDPNGDVVAPLATSCVTATCLPDLSANPPICTQASAIGTGNVIDIWVYKECSPVPMSVNFIVTGRPPAPHTP